MMQTWQIRTAADFGNAIRAARIQQKLTQRELALSTGTGERFIVDLENGKETAQLGKALEVVTSLGIQVSMTPEG